MAKVVQEKNILRSLFMIILRGAINLLLQSTALHLMTNSLSQDFLDIKGAHLLVLCKIILVFLNLLIKAQYFWMKLEISHPDCSRVCYVYYKTVKYNLLDIQKLNLWM